MRRYLLAFLLLCVPCFAQTIFSAPYSTSLNAVTDTATGKVFTTQIVNGLQPTIFTMTTTISGFSAVNVQLMGSVDNTNWFSLQTSTNATGELLSVSGSAVSFLRCDLISKTGSGSVTCNLAAAASSSLAWVDLVTETSRAENAEGVALSYAQAAVTPQKLQGQNYTFGNDTGPVNTYRVTITPNIVAMTPPTQVVFKALHTNTGDSTLTVGGGYPYSIYKQGGTAPLVAGDIVAGQIVNVVFDGTNFEMQSQIANAPAGGLPSGWTSTGSGTSQVTTIPGAVAAGTTLLDPVAGITTPRISTTLLPATGGIVPNSTLVPVAPYDSIPTSGSANFGPTSGTSFEWVSLGHLYRIRQTGMIVQTKIYVPSLTGVTGIYLKIWRANGTNYDLVGTSQNFIGSVTNGAISTVTITPGVSVKEGDYIGGRIESAGFTVQNLFTSASVNASGETAYTYSVANATPGASAYNWASQTASTSTIEKQEVDMSAPVFAFTGNSIDSGAPNNYSFADTASASTAMNVPYAYNVGLALNASYQNFGHAGWQLPQILADFAKGPGAVAPKYVVAEGGVNDILFGAATLPTLQASWTTFLGNIQAIGAVPIAIGILPFSNYVTCSPCTTAMTLRDQLNSWLATQVGSYGGYYINPDVYVGSYATNGPVGNLWTLSALYDNGDHIHPNPAGHQRLAQAIVDVLTSSKSLGTTFLQPALTGQNYIRPFAGAVWGLVFQPATDADAGANTVGALNAAGSSWKWQITNAGAATLTSLSAGGTAITSSGLTTNVLTVNNGGATPNTLTGYTQIIPGAGYGYGISIKPSTDSDVAKFAISGTNAAGDSTKWSITHGGIASFSSYHYQGATGSIAFAGTFTTTAATSDNVATVAYAGSGHCMLTPTNAAAAANIATTYVSAKLGGNTITVTHTATAGMTYDLICTTN